MVEWARLESVCGSNVTVGSNPTLSAIVQWHFLKGLNINAKRPS